MKTATKKSNTSSHTPTKAEDAGLIRESVVDDDLRRMVEMALPQLANPTTASAASIIDYVRWDSRGQSAPECLYLVHVTIDGWRENYDLLDDEAEWENFADEQALWCALHMECQAQALLEQWERYQDEWAKWDYEFGAYAHFWGWGENSAWPSIDLFIDIPDYTPNDIPDYD